jgi:CRP-like cAMP-binding protein
MSVKPVFGTGSPNLLALPYQQSYSQPMSTNPLQSFVARLRLRTPLRLEEQDAVLSLPAETVRIKGHRDLVALGQQTDSSYLVVSGVIGRFSQLRNGVRQIVALHIPGDMADLCSVALPKTSWAFHALTSAEVLRISHADLIAISAQYHNIAVAFWRDCVADMAVMSEWIVSVARRPAEAKIAHLLCEMRCRYKQAGMLALDGSYVFAVTQLQIAEVLGITAIHANRMIRSLKDRGLASVSKSAVEIHDWAGLVELAEFDTAYLHLDNNHAER